jgi:hypothetical protein
MIQHTLNPSDLIQYLMALSSITSFQTILVGWSGLFWSSMHLVINGHANASIIPENVKDLGCQMVKAVSDAGHC